MYVHENVSVDKEPLAREGHQLPSGRHGLPRSFVVSNQRERILNAVAEVASAKGFGGMTVEDIISEAGLSRRTFYEHFKNKDAAFLAAYDAVLEQVVARVVAAFQSGEGFVARIAGGLDAFLSFIASEPSFADPCIVEVLAAGPEAIERRNSALRAFARLVEEAAEDLPGDQPRPPALAAETIVGGIYEVVFTRI